jgi:hypothetical protein
MRNAVSILAVVVAMGFALGGCTPAANGLVQAADSAAKDQGLTRYADKKNGFSLGYPSDWVTPPDDFMKALKDLQRPGTDMLFARLSPDMMLNLQVARTHLNKPMTAQEFFDSRTADMKKNAAISPKFTTEQVKIGDIPVVRVVVEMNSPGGRPMKSMAVYFVKGKTGWSAVVGGKPDSFEDQRDLCERSLMSLNIK